MSTIVMIDRHEDGVVLVFVKICLVPDDVEANASSSRLCWSGSDR